MSGKVSKKIDIGHGLYNTKNMVIHDLINAKTQGGD